MKKSKLHIKWDASSNVDKWNELFGGKYITDFNIESLKKLFPEFRQSTLHDGVEKKEPEVYHEASKIKIRSASIRFRTIKGSHLRIDAPRLLTAIRVGIIRNG
jgi:hypothetical protein